MRSREYEVLRALTGAHQFVARHAEQLPDVVSAGMYRRLGETLQRVQLYVNEQAARDLAAKGATQAVEQAREDLIRDHMRPITAIADLLASQRGTARVLKMPRKYMPAEPLVALARAMAEHAMESKASYVDLGLPDDFADRLDAAAVRLIDRVIEQGMHLAARAAATEGARAGISRARKQLNAVDALVRRTIRADAALLAEWTGVKRLPRASQKAKVEPSAQPVRLLPATTGVVESAIPSTEVLMLRAGE